MFVKISRLNADQGHGQKGTALVMCNYYLTAMGGKVLSKDIGVKIIDESALGFDAVLFKQKQIKM